MAEPAIRVHNLSKIYRIGQQEKSSDTLIGAVGQFLGSPGKNLRRLRRLTLFDPNGADAADIIWALRNVSFEVQAGEVVGIIGRNGAGKSTLLKILSQITHPTSGRAELLGRVASLLEVGTGFHPELTGRENVYLNGTLLGMRKAEIDRKFDEIVDFSGVEKFIDTPVKRYSSGMRVRLGFAVAAFLEPEILMVDEVLAVGDAEFQKKSLGKMDQVARAGRTVIFVSHQLAAVQNICRRSILLNDGSIVLDGPTNEVLTSYLSEAADIDGVAIRDVSDRGGDGSIRFESIRLFDSSGKQVKQARTGEDFVLQLAFANHSKQDLHNIQLDIGIDDHFGKRITVLSNESVQGVFSTISKDHDTVEITVKKTPLMPGRYYLTIFSKSGHRVLDWVKTASFFDVEAGDYYGTGRIPTVNSGNFLVDCSFQSSTSMARKVRLSNNDA